MEKTKKSNFFLTCFGFSFEPVLEGENPSKMVINITPTKKNIINKKKNKNPIRWFSSSPGLEDFPGGRNAPAASKSKKSAGDGDDTSAGDSDHKRSRRSTRKSSSLKCGDSKANQKTPRWDQDSAEITSAPATEENRSDQTTHGVEESIVPGNKKSAGYVEAGENDRCQKRQSFAQKIDAIRSPKSQPGSPKIEPKSDRMAPSRSTFVDKSVVKPAAKLATISDNPFKENSSRYCDPLIGTSIMLLTLLILLLWGRVCAVLCACAWLYFVPLLRTIVGQDRTVKFGPDRNVRDIGSEECKKRVVLEGFLERAPPVWGVIFFWMVYYFLFIFIFFFQM